jgi:hypothetical protein
MGASVHNPSAREKRQHRRVQESCEVEFYANGKAYKGVSENVSIDGLLIRTDNLTALQSVVTITVHLPDGSHGKLKGRVRRVHKVTGSAAESGQTAESSMGIENMERDSNYIKFFMSLLRNNIKF